MQPESRIMVPPVKPYRGLRGIDAWGAGGFGAPRSKGDARYAHPGLDFISLPGDSVVRPIPGTVVHLGSAYADDPRTPEDESLMGSIHIRGSGIYSDWLVRLFYVKPLEVLGEAGPSGSGIGLAQDRAALAHAQHPERGPMQNHCHLGLWINGTLTDPTAFLRV